MTKTSGTENIENHWINEATGREQSYAREDKICHSVYLTYSSVATRNLLFRQNRFAFI